MALPIGRTAIVVATTLLVAGILVGTFLLRLPFGVAAIAAILGIFMVVAFAQGLSDLSKGRAPATDAPQVA